MTEVRKHLAMNWGQDLILQLTEIYTSYIEIVLPLQNGVGYLDCTKVKFSRPSGPIENSALCILTTRGLGD